LGVPPGLKNVIECERQFGAQEAFVSNVGRSLNDQTVQRWRHRVSADWQPGSVGVMVGNSCFSAHTDDSYPAGLAPRKVEACSLWDLSTSWRINKNLQVRAGIQNLLDTDPSFSNQSYYFLSTYDPTYTDPRGRNFYASLKYTF
jgi:iron complex outermembrane receptor protein